MPWKEGSWPNVGTVPAFLSRETEGKQDKPQSRGSFEAVYPEYELDRHPSVNHLDGATNRASLNQ
jgi:hypothetical protein